MNDKEGGKVVTYGPQYSEQIDKIIYWSCSNWEPTKFIDLAIAAIDQAINPNDIVGRAILELLEKYKKDMN